METEKVTMGGGSPHLAAPPAVSADAFASRPHLSVPEVPDLAAGVRPEPVHALPLDGVGLAEPERTERA